MVECKPEYEYIFKLKLFSQANWHSSSYQFFTGQRWKGGDGWGKPFGLKLGINCDILVSDFNAIVSPINEA